MESEAPESIFVVATPALEAMSRGGYLNSSSEKHEHIKLGVINYTHSQS